MFLFLTYQFNQEIMRLTEYFSLHVIAYLAMLLMSVPGKSPINTKFTCKEAAEKTQVAVTVAETQTDAQDFKSELLLGF